MTTTTTKFKVRVPAYKYEGVGHITVTLTYPTAEKAIEKRDEINRAWNSKNKEVLSDIAEQDLFDGARAEGHITGLATAHEIVTKDTTL